MVIHLHLDHRSAHVGCGWGRRWRVFPLRPMETLGDIGVREGRMSEEKVKLSGPDLTQGVELTAIPDGTMLLGHAQGEPVLLARRGDEVFPIGAICTHYGAPLEQGLLDGDTVRCQWHHACFSLGAGEALQA